MRRLAVLLAGFAIVAAGLAPPASADDAYRPPVDVPVVDAFRPPPEPWAAGNRGLDYATSPGTEVRAAGDGEVVFAGLVADSLHVVVLHPDGIRTSYSFLGSIRVQRGDHVTQGQVLGTAGQQPFHFGARAGDAYVDPALLFGAGPPQVHLVPDSERRPGSEAHERSGLLGMLAGLAGDAVGATADAVGWAADGAASAGGWTAGQAGSLAAAAGDAIAARARGALGDIRALVARCAEAAPPVALARLAISVSQLVAGQGDCTPASVIPPKVQGHIAVLVGGLGSSGSTSGSKLHGAAVFRVNTGALGYAPGDVVGFSYRGGTVAEHPYGKADTEVDIRRSGRRLRALLQRIQAEHPGVSIDILAHSQGGLVTRAALAAPFDKGEARLSQVSSVVTMGSPHQGTDGATAVALVRLSPAGDAALAGAHTVLPKQDDPRALSIAQMAEGSRFIRWLNHRPLPKGLRFTSIGGREDWLVPANHTHLAGARNVIVAVHSPTAHDDLPSSAAAQREAALALNAMPPTCRGLLTNLADRVVPSVIDHAEHAPLPLPRGGTP